MTLTCLLQAIAQRQLSGTIVDDEGQPVVAAAVCYEGNKIYTISDVDGKFSIVRREGHTLTVTCLGMNTLTVKVDKSTSATLNLVMKNDTQTLKEVVVKHKKEKYSRKNNPAVELMKRVIEAKKKTDLENNDFYQFVKYQKLTLSVNDYKVQTADSAGQKKSLWADQTEVSPYNGKVILPVSVDETVTRHIYRKDPKKSKDIIQGEKSTGLNQLFATGEMVNTTLKDVFQDVDIYEDYVRLLQYPFISPIGSTAIGFYRYYIKDTVQVDNDSCYHLTFIPNNQQDFGFTGDLWILKDSTLHVKKCALSIPHKSDVNFVDKMHIDQQYVKLPNGDWALETDDMWAELKAVNKSLLVVRNTRLSNYSFSPLPKKLFNGHAEVKRLPNAKRRDDTFWSQYRKVDLTESESSFDSFIARLQNNPKGKAVLFVMKPIVENYIETTTKPGEKSKVDIGPVLSMVSQNYVDGLRLSLGARTTAALNPHFFWRGFVAHGMRSNDNYYLTEFTYAFNKKENSSFEFPQRNLSFESTFDVMSPSDKFLSNSKDNVILGIRTQKVEEMYQYHRQKLSFVYETEGGFSVNTWLKCELDRPMGAMHYIRLSDGFELADLRTTEAYLSLRYCPGQTFVNNKQKRIPITLDSPEFYVRHTAGFKGLLGGAYMSNLTEIGFYKRQWLGSWGHIDLNVDAGAQWNKVPFPSLIMPPTDLSYIDQQGTFSLLRNMEFLMDRKLMWQLHWNLNGKLLNRIPLIKKLKWREHMRFKGIWGALTDKNNPTLADNQSDPDLFRFPDCTYVIDSHKPYMEVEFGIHNVFKFLSLDYVHRMNYNDHTGTHKNGVRFGIYLTF